MLLSHLAKMHIVTSRHYIWGFWCQRYKIAVLQKDFTDPNSTNTIFTSKLPMTVPKKTLRSFHDLFFINVLFFINNSNIHAGQSSLLLKLHRSLAVTYVSHRSLVVTDASHRSLAVTYVSHRSLVVTYVSHRSLVVTDASRRSLAVTYVSHRSLVVTYVSECYTCVVLFCVCCTVVFCNLGHSCYESLKKVSVLKSWKS